MPSRDFEIVFTANTSQAVAGMKFLEGEFKMLESYINGTGSGLGNMAGQLNNLTAQCHAAGLAMNGTGGAANGMLTSMLSMGAGFLVIEGGMAAIGNLGEMANRTRERISEMAVETMGLRDRLRELANLKGAQGPDNVIAGETIEMAVEAGMMPEQMVKYLEQFEGSIPAGEQKKHIDDKTKKELALEGAKFASRVNLAPETGGDLAGVISQYTDLTKDKNGKDIPQAQRTAKAMEQMGRIEYGLNMGRGKIETLTRSLINTAGAVVGPGMPIEDLGDLAAIQGVASTHANPKESGTRVRQSVRALQEKKGDRGNFLQRVAGIKDSDSYIERLEKVKVAMDKANAAGISNSDYLDKNGFDANEDEKRAVIEQANDVDIIKLRIKEGREKVTGKAVIDRDAAFQTQERVGMRRSQMTRKAGQEFLIGEGAERIEMAKENAEQRLRARGAIGGDGNNFGEWAGDLGGLRTWFGYQSTREKMKQGEAERGLMQEAGRVGIPEEQARRMLGYSRHSDAKTGESYWDGSQRDEATVRRNFNTLATEVERRGGNGLGSGPDLKPELKAMMEEQKETNRILKQIAGNRPAAAMPPVRAAAQPKRP